MAKPPINFQKDDRLTQHIHGRDSQYGNADAVLTEIRSRVLEISMERIIEYPRSPKRQCGL